LLAERIREESGYSLVEVMVAIFILAIAIIPMVGMFDTGLHSATAGSNYDRARMLANANLEKVRSLPYSSARVSFKPVNATPTPGTPVSCDQGIFDCEVTTTYVDDDFNPNSSFIIKMRVVVTVEWDGGNKSYTTTGLIAR
jgi:prepilin-type N-terminal cleavage/methylation domain-containing protein